MRDPSRREDGIRFARRGSSRLAYVALGRGGDGTTSILALHGLLADRSAFASLRGAAAGLGSRLLLPDARGHGATAAVAGRRFTLGELADDAAAVLDAEGFERAHLVGHGLGGATALALAGTRPDRVRSLVLVEPSLPGLATEDGDAAARWAAGQARERLRVVADLADKGLVDRALDAYLEPRLGPDWRERLPRPRSGAIRRHAAALGPLLAALAAPGIENAIRAGLRAPTLLLRAEGAQPLDRVAIDRLVALAPAVRLAVVPGSVDDFDLASGDGGKDLICLVIDFLAGQEGAGVAPREAPSPESG